MDDLLELKGDGLFLDPSQLDAQALLPFFIPQVRPEHVSLHIPSEEDITLVSAAGVSQTMGHGDNTTNSMDTDSIETIPPIMEEEAKEGCDNEKESQSTNMDDCVA